MSPYAFAFPLQRSVPMDRYRIVAVTSAAELDTPKGLPVEIQYVLAARPEWVQGFRRLLKEGFGIGVRAMDCAPGHVLRAADRIAEQSQENTILPWLASLLREGEIPVFTREEMDRAREQGVDLYQEASRMLEERHAFRKIVLIDLHNRRMREEDQAFMREVNAALAPLALHAGVQRIALDRSRTRPKLGAAFLKATFFIGPISHLLEWWMAGLGKVFSALAEDVLSEGAELFTLRQSGLTRRQLTRRLWMVAPGAVIAAAAAFQVQPLLRAGHVGWAGFVFGASAALLPLIASVQSIVAHRAAHATLVRNGKFTLAPGQTLWGAAIRQDFVNPARLGFFVGALCTPALAALLFMQFPAYTQNGWLLAFTATLPTAVSALIVAATDPVERWWFRRRAHAEIRNTLSSHA